jgi:dihydrofolate reductase
LKKLKYSHIVACSKNRVIGVNGSLPWRLPNDLKKFKELTLGHIIVMGRKTFDSIKKPLPGRKSIVLSKQELASPDGVLQARSFEEVFVLCENLKEYGEEVFIIGGGEIYKQSLQFVDTVYLTEVQTVTEGDTYYPELTDFKVFESSFFDDTVPSVYKVFKRK